MLINENKIFSSGRSQDIEEKIEEALAAHEKKNSAIMDRVNQIIPIHEDIIIIQKIDVQSCKTFLALDQKGSSDRLRLSYYGRILKISPIDSMDPVKEDKKNNIKVGNVVQFNPDSGYSLNIIVPSDMPEIWVISIDNILCIDSGFDPIETLKKTTESQIMIAEARRRQIAMRVAANSKKKNS